MGIPPQTSGLDNHLVLLVHRSLGRVEPSPSQIPQFNSRPFPFQQPKFGVLGLPFLVFESVIVPFSCCSLMKDDSSQPGGEQDGCPLQANWAEWQ